MENLKLISVRIVPDALEKIDQLARQHMYWNRNQIINALLVTVFNDFDDKSVYDMIRRQNFDREPVKAEYKILNLYSPDDTNNPPFCDAENK